MPGKQRRFRLLANIGVPDAKKFGLVATREGDVIPVADEKVAAELLRRRLVVEVEDGAEGEAAASSATSTAPRDLKAVPPVDLRSGEAEGEVKADSPAPPDTPPNFDEMTKEELKAYADAHKFQGVSMSQTKDEMVAQVKREARRAAR